MIAGVFNSGLLARSRPPVDANYDYQIAPAKLIARANSIADVCERHGVTLPEAAIAFVLRHPRVASVVIGTSRLEQFEQTLERYRAEVPEALWEELVAEGLVERAAVS